MSCIFNYEEFEKQIRKLKDSYNSQSPYPYALFDGLFDDKALNEVDGEVDAGNFNSDDRKLDNIEVKLRSDFEDNEAVPDNTKEIFQVLNGGKFLNLVSQLTGIDGLISDPYFDGGGINIIKNNGTLAVHVDGTHQHRMKVSRRINAILFLNEDWDENWNGFHEQWEYLNTDISPFDEMQKWRCVRKILPKRNRLLIFTTNDHSWHGHAGVLNVPDHIERRSLITYYYTNERPQSDIIFESPHRALFVNNNITLKESSFDDVEIIL